jgi:hypothetical protein
MANYSEMSNQSDVQACKDACDADASCQAFETNEPFAGSCWLFRNTRGQLAGEDINATSHCFTKSSHDNGSSCVFGVDLQLRYHTGAGVGACVTVDVGSSTSYLAARPHFLPEAYVCPTVVDRNNWVGNGRFQQSMDTFNVTQAAGVISVVRVDPATRQPWPSGQSWGTHLKFQCCQQSVGWATLSDASLDIDRPFLNQPTFGLSGDATWIVSRTSAYSLLDSAALGGDPINPTMFLPGHTNRVLANVGHGDMGSIATKRLYTRPVDVSVEMRQPLNAGTPGCGHLGLFTTSAQSRHGTGYTAGLGGQDGSYFYTSAPHETHGVQTLKHSHGHDWNTVRIHAHGNGNTYFYLNGILLRTDVASAASVSTGTVRLGPNCRPWEYRNLVIDATSPAQRAATQQTKLLATRSQVRAQCTCIPEALECTCILDKAL